MNSVFFDINKEVSIFTFADQSTLILDIGYQKLIKLHFKRDRPTAYQTEAAIITIEDAIERL